MLLLTERKRQGNAPCFPTGSMTDVFNCRGRSPTHQVLTHGPCLLKTAMSLLTLQAEPQSAAKGLCSSEEC